MAEVIQEAIRAELLDLHVALPARVEKYDKNTQKANVKPLLRKRYKSDGMEIEMPIIPGVPVQHPSANGGKAFIHLPIKKGDLGTAIFCDRSIDRWLAGDGRIVTPDDPRHHDLSDAIFIPGVLPFSEALLGVSSNNLIIKNDALTIELDPNGKVGIGATDDLLAILSDFMQHVHDAVDTNGDSFNPGTKALLTADKGKIDGLKL